MNALFIFVFVLAVTAQVNAVPFGEQEQARLEYEDELYGKWSIKRNDFSILD